MPNYFCGIDPGIANLAICIVQDDPFEVSSRRLRARPCRATNATNARTQIVYLQKINVFQGPGGEYYKFDNKAIVHMLQKYVQDNAAAYFSKVKLFVVENQMTRAMFRVQFGLEGILSHYGRVVPVHPTTVKCHFGTRTGTYKGNKNAAVQYVRANLKGINLRRFNGYVQGLNKADDAADAVLLAMYAAQNADDLMPLQLRPWSPKAPPKRKRRKVRRKAPKRNRTMDEYIKT